MLRIIILKRLFQYFKCFCCTTTTSNYSLKIPQKLWEVIWGLPITFVQKPNLVFWKFWVKHPLFISALFLSLNYNPNFYSSNDSPIFTTCKPPNKTLKSRRSSLIASFKSTKYLSLVSVQKWIPLKLALTSFSLCQTNYTIISTN